jgi:hypothetical protein
MTRHFALLAVLLGAPLPLAAQDTVLVARGVPADERAVRIFNGENTTRLYGEQSVSRGVVIRTDLGVLDGSLNLYGTVEGDLVAVNADVSIYSGAEVTGNVLVVGGTLFVSQDADVGGTVERHSERIGVREVDGRLELTGERLRRVVVQGDRRLRRSYHRGQASLALTTGRTYNRVEGLAVMGGPRITWSDRHTAVRLEALGIWRTATGFGPDLDNREVGYDALASLRLGPERQVEIGGRAFDVVAPVEDWQLRDDEAGLATLLWHRDYRDYYLDRGVAGFVRVNPSPEFTLFGELARTEATSVAARDPWTPFRNAEPWRPNPLVDEGTFTRVIAGLDLDNQYGGRWSTGIQLHAEWEHGRSDDVVEHVLPLAVRPPLPLTPYTYDRVFGDLRLFQPVGWGELRLRAAGGTVLGDAPLPMQRRFSLGGPEPMPGYGFRRFACNDFVADPALPALCDRMVLFQAEYRGGLGINPFDGPWDRDAWHRRGDRDWGDWEDFWWDGPQFVLFADAGNAWLKGTDPGRLHWDVGLGLEVGSVGLYAARAVERSQPLRWTLRIHRRF